MNLSNSVISQFGICAFSKISGLDWWMDWNDELILSTTRVFSRWGELFNHGVLGSILVWAGGIFENQSGGNRSLICNGFTQEWKHWGQRERRKGERFWILNIIWGKKRSTLIFASYWEKYIILHQMKTSLFKMQYFLLKSKQIKMQEIRLFYYRMNTW